MPHLQRVQQQQQQRSQCYATVKDSDGAQRLTIGDSINGADDDVSVQSHSAGGRGIAQPNASTYDSTNRAPSPPPATPPPAQPANLLVLSDDRDRWDGHRETSAIIMQAEAMAKGLLPSSPVTGPDHCSPGAHSQTDGSQDPQSHHYAGPELWLSKWLYHLKTYYLFVHMTYILICSFIGALVMFIAERSNGHGIVFLDVWFVAMSCTTCTGLMTFDIGKLTHFSTWMRHILMICGGMCFTSAIMPVLRMITLRKLRSDVAEARGDSERRRKWKRRKRAFVERLVVTAKISTVTTYIVWFFLQLLGWVILMFFSDFNAEDALLHTIAAFQGCTMTSMISENRYASIVFVLSFLCAAGSPILPCFLRLFFLIERRIFMFFLSRRWCGKIIHNRAASTRASFASAASALPGDGEALVGLTAEQQLRISRVTVPDFDDTRDGHEWMDHLKDSKWLRGFNAIVQTDNPVTYHFFLFVPGETWYILVAWILICLFQAFPYTFQQWNADGVLEGHSWGQKLLIAYGQSAGTRFAGINFVDIRHLLPAHIMTIMFALYIPQLPIPTDRTRKKWKAMFSSGAWRLLTSRFWWLFIAIMLICFFEEQRTEVAERILDTPYGFFSRAMFEVLSAYATSGLSLSVGDAPYSFSGSCTIPSQIVIMIVMLAGRHRGMDLGIDIGLSELEAKEREMQDIEDRKRLEQLVRQNAELDGLLGVAGSAPGGSTSSNPVAARQASSTNYFKGLALKDSRKSSKSTNDVQPTTFAQFNSEDDEKGPYSGDNNNTSPGSSDANDQEKRPLLEQRVHRRRIARGTTAEGGLHTAARGALSYSGRGAASERHQSKARPGVLVGSRETDLQGSIASAASSSTASRGLRQQRAGSVRSVVISGEDESSSGSGRGSTTGDDDVSVRSAAVATGSLNHQKRW